MGDSGEAPPLIEGELLPPEEPPAPSLAEVVVTQGDAKASLEFTPQQKSAAVAQVVGRQWQENPVVEPPRDSKAVKGSRLEEKWVTRTRRARARFLAKFYADVDEHYNELKGLLYSGEKDDMPRIHLWKEIIRHMFPSVKESAGNNNAAAPVKIEIVGVKRGG